LGGRKATLVPKSVRYVLKKRRGRGEDEKRGKKKWGGRERRKSGK